MARKTREQLLEENPPVYLVRISLRNGGTVLLWALTFSIQHDGEALTGLDWAVGDARDSHPMWLNLKEIVSIEEVRRLPYVEYVAAVDRTEGSS